MLSVFMSIVLVMGLCPGLAVANDGSQLAAGNSDLKVQAEDGALQAQGDLAAQALVTTGYMPANATLTDHATTPQTNLITSPTFSAAVKGTPGDDAATITATYGGTSLKYFTAVEGGTKGSWLGIAIPQVEGMTQTYAKGWKSSTASEASTYDTAATARSATEAISEKPYDVFYFDLSVADNTDNTAYVKAKFSQDSESDVIVTYELNFAAVVLQSFRVSFNVNYTGGTNPGSINVETGRTWGTQGTEQIVLDKPTRDGYSFAGWFLDSNGTESIGTRVDLTQNTTLYAKWGASTSTVTFDANAPFDATNAALFHSGTTAGQLTVANGGLYGEGTGLTYDPSSSKTAGLPVAYTTDTAYKFQGWYTSKTDGTLITDDDLVELDDTTQILYAHWTAATYTLTFNAMGGVNTVPSMTVTYGEPYGALPTPVAGSDAAFTGKEFKGWFKCTTAPTTVGGAITPNDNNVKLTEDMLVDLTANTVVYASWDYPVYEFALMGNGGGIYASDKPFTVYVRDNATKTATFAGSVYLKNPDEESASRMDLENLTVSAPTGYTFTPSKGWYTTPVAGKNDTDTTNLVTNASKASTTPKTLYARYTAIPVTVTLNPEGGTIANPKADVDATSGTTLTNVTLAATYGKTLAEATATGTALATNDVTFKGLPVPTKAGYEFDGWYTGTSASDPAGKLVSAGDTVTWTASQNIYARWIANDVTVTFDAKGGTVDPATSTFTVGKTYGKLPTPKKAGYEFGGWYGDSSFTEASKVITATDVNAAFTTLYAKFTEETSYSIKYFLNGGAWKAYQAPSSADRVYTISSDAKTLPTADSIQRQITGSSPAAYYTFVGWHERADLTDDVVTTLPKGSTGNKIYYAEWEGTTAAPLYKVTFDSKGGSDVAAQQVESGKTASAPVAATGNPSTDENNSLLPTRKGYMLDSTNPWLVGGEGYAFTEAVTANVTVEANWTANAIRLTYDATINVKDKTDESRTATLSTASTKNVRFGSTYGALATATLSGYTFGGWFAKVEGNGTKESPYVWSEPITALTTVSDPTITTLHAKLTPNSYKVTLDPNGGELTRGAATEFDVTYDTAWKLPVASSSDPDAVLISRTGYTFPETGGWRLGAENGTAVGEYVGITEDTKLVAAWTGQNRTVTYRYNSTTGDPVPPAINWEASQAVTVTYGQSYEFSTPAKPADPAVTGYDFKGWFTEKVGGEQVTTDDVVEFGAETTDTQDLYAQWAPKTTAVNLIDGRPGSTTARTVTATYGEPWSFQPATVPAGYSFKGWNTVADQDTATTTIEGDSWTGTASALSLYGVWGSTPYTVKLVMNGGTAMSSDMTTAGWTAITNDQSTRNFGVATAAFNLPGASDFTAPSGFTFGGWFANPDFSGSAVASIPRGSTGDKVFYAKWTKDNTFAVTFDANGGTPVSAQFVARGGDVTTAPTTTRTGYEYTGGTTTPHTLQWHYNSATGAVATFPLTNITANTKLVASWKATETTITLDADGGKLPANADATIKADYDAKYSTAYYGTGVSKVTSGLPEPTKAGYEFDGWYTVDASDNLVDKVTNDSAVSAAGTQTLKAKWVREGLVVTFSANATDGVIDVETAVAPVGGSGTVILPNGERTGYAIEGWYTDEACTVSAGGSPGDTSIPVTKDVTFYAKWTTVPSGITYDLDGGALGRDANNVQLVNPRTYTVEDEFTLSNPTKAGYTFAGWIDLTSTSDTPLSTVNIAKGTTGAKSYKATWAPRVYTVKFVDDNGAQLASNSYDYNTPWGDVEVPEVADRIVNGMTYEFGRWTPAISDVVADTTYTVERKDGVPTTFKLDVNSDSLFSATNNLPSTYGSGANIDLTTTYLPTNPKTGYQFSGWYVKTDVVEPASAALPYTPKEGAQPVTALVGGSGVDYTGDTELYATWQLISYDVVYRLEGGTNAATNPESYTVEDVANADKTLADPTKANYVFKNWQISTDNEATWADAKGIAKGSSGKVFFKAVWTPTLVSIAEIPDQYVGDPAPAITVYTSNGVALTGTALTTQATVRHANNTAVGTATVTVTARTGADKLYSGTVTANYNIVSKPTDVAGLREAIAKAQELLGDTTNLTNESKDTDPGKTIYEDAAAGSYYAANSAYTAYQQAIVNATNVSNNVNPSAAQIVAAANALQEATNTFAGARQQVTIDPSSKNELADDLTAANKLYTDTYTASEDGTDVAHEDLWLTPEDMAAFKAAIDAAQATHDSATASNKDVAEATEALADAVEAAGKAAHKGLKKITITVTFDANGGTFEDGSTIKTVTATEGERYPKAPEQPTRLGYEFGSWRAAGSSADFNFESVVSENAKDVTLVASDWHEISYTISYHLNGAKWTTAGQPTTAKLTYNVNSASVVLPVATDMVAPTATGYDFEFLGWYDNATFQGDSVLSITQGSTGDKEFYAQWKKVAKDSETVKTIDDVTLSGEVLAAETPEGEKLLLDVSNESADTAKVTAATDAVKALDRNAEAVLENADVFLFDVDLKVVDENNESVVDAEATDEVKGTLAEKPLTLSFYVGARYAGFDAVVYHLHEGTSLVPTQPTTVTPDGYVTISVTQLSEFVIAIQQETPAPETLEVYRMYDGARGEHFYTTDAEERDFLVSIGWVYEKIGWYAPTSGDEVYRLYNPNGGGMHFYTTDASERDFLVSVGWNYEPMELYSAPAATGVIVYRDANPNSPNGEHNYTTDVEEHSWLDSIGWVDESAGGGMIYAAQAGPTE